MTSGEWMGRCWRVTLLFVGTSFLCAQVYAQEDSKEARRLLDAAIGEFTGTGDWKSEAFASSLKKVTEQYQTTSEALTAKTLLIGHFQNLDSAESLRVAANLAREVVSTAPASWQAGFARICLTAIYGLQGNYEKQKTFAKEALATTDFAAIEKATDKDFDRVRAVFAIDASDMREVLYVLLANAEAQTGNIEQAQQTLLSVKNERLKAGVEGGIEYYKKRLREKGVVSIDRGLPPNSVASQPPPSSPAPTTPVPTATPASSPPSATPVAQTPAAIVERKSPVWLWLVGMLALVVIVAVALKRRA